MPNRIIKESIRGSEDLATVSPEAERLFWRLVVSVDDFGRFDARTKTIIGQCLTAFLGNISAFQVDKWLAELESAGLLQLYVVEDRPYLVLTKWRKHQRVRAKDSKFPSPEDSCGHPQTFDSKCSQPLTNDSTCGHPQTSASSYVNDNENVFVNENVNEDDNENGKNESSSSNEIASIARTFEGEGFGVLTPLASEKLLSLYQDFGYEWLMDAFAESVTQNVRKLSYVERMLGNWKKEGHVHGYNSRLKESTSKQKSNEASGPFVPAGIPDDLEQIDIERREYERLAELRHNES